MSQEKTIHQFQRMLFLNQNPNINVKIVEPYLYAQNITVEDVCDLEFVTNDPSFMNNNYEHLVGINVYLDSKSYPTKIYGLLEIVSDHMKSADVIAYANKERTYKPFKNGFGNSRGINRNVDDLINVLSELSHSVPDTKGKIKLIELIMDEDPDQPANKLAFSDVAVA
jgi:hypothetical protein